MHSRWSLAVLLVVAFLAATSPIPVWAQQYQVPIIPPPPDDDIPLIPGPSDYAPRDLIERTVLCLNERGPCDPEVLQFLARFAGKRGPAGSRGPRGLPGRAPSSGEIRTALDQHFRKALEDPRRTELEDLRTILREWRWATGNGREFRLKSWVGAVEILRAMARLSQVHGSEIRKVRTTLSSLLGRVQAVEERLNDPKTGLTALDTRLQSVESRPDGIPNLWKFLVILALVLAILALLCCLDHRRPLEERWAWWPYRRRRVVVEEVPPAPVARPEERRAEASAAATRSAEPAREPRGTQPSAAAPSQPEYEFFGSIVSWDVVSDREGVVNVSAAHVDIEVPAGKYPKPRFRTRTQFANADRQEGTWLDRTTARPGEKVEAKVTIWGNTEEVPFSEITLQKQVIGPVGTVGRDHLVYAWMQVGEGEQDRFTLEVDDWTNFNQPLSKLNTQVANWALRPGRPVYSIIRFTVGEPIAAAA